MMHLYIDGFLLKFICLLLGIYNYYEKEMVNQIVNFMTLEPWVVALGHGHENA